MNGTGIIKGGNIELEIRRRKNKERGIMVISYFSS
jgi:hypothetical protein